MPRDKYGFPAASKLLHRQEQDRAFKLHRQKVHEVRPGLDNSAPRRYPHLVLRLKQTQQEEEYLATVDHDNKLLLQKMMKIMEKRGGGVDNHNDYKAKSLNQPYKQRQANRIERENLEIARRLESVKPIYRTEKWEEDHKRHMYYLDLWADGTKEYTPRGTEKAKDEDEEGQQKDKEKKEGKDDEYESDFESDDEDHKKGDDKKADDNKGDKKADDKEGYKKADDKKGDKKVEDKMREKKAADKKGDKKGDDKKGDKLPAIEQDKQQKKQGDTKRPGSSSSSSSDSSVEQLPDIKDKNKNDKKDKEKDKKDKDKNDKKDKDKEKDGDKGKSHQAETDAKHLFRVAKTMSPPHDIFIRTLVRRTPSQRQQIKQKFKELYELDLQKELKQGLDKDWHLLVDALLSEDKPDKDDKKGSGRGREKGQGQGKGHGKGHGRGHGKGQGRSRSRSRSRSSSHRKGHGRSHGKGQGRSRSRSRSRSSSHGKGHGRGHGKGHGKGQARSRSRSRSHSRSSSRGSHGGGTENALHQALQKGDIPAVVQVLADMTDSQINKLQDSYKKEYAIGLDADIRDRTKDPVQLFLLTLLKDKKDGGDKKDAHTDATAIFESGEGRWSTPSGIFIKLLEERTNKHMRAVLLKYHQVSDGTTAEKAIEEECSKEYATVVQAFLSKDKGKGKDRDGSGGGKDEESAKECALLLYKNLHPQNETFVYTLVERAEVDMPAVRKAYKKKYKSELHTDLDERSRQTTVNVLIELILKTPPGKGKGQDKDGKGKNGNEGQKKGHDKHQGQHHDNKQKSQGQRKGHVKQDGEQQHAQRSKSVDQKKSHDKHDDDVQHDQKNKGQSQKKGDDKRNGDEKHDQKTKGQSQKKGDDKHDDDTHNDQKEKGQGQKKDHDKHDGDEKHDQKNKGQGQKKDDDKHDVDEQHDKKSKGQGQKKGHDKRDGDEKHDQKSKGQGQKKGHDKHDGDEQHVQKTKGQGKKKGHDKHDGDEQHDQKTKGQGQKKGHDKHDGDGQHQQKDKGQGQKKGQDKKQDGGGQNKSSPFGQTSKRGMAEARENKKKEENNKGKEGDKKKKKDEDDGDEERLHKAMDGLGTDEDTILDIIISKTNAQRQSLKKKYKDKYKKELADDLKSELSGDFEEVMLGLLMPPVEYDAHCLHSAVKGLGTNEDVLIGIMCTANPKELSAVKEQYKKAYGEELDNALKGDTSGGFADLLTALSQGQRDQGTNVNEKEAKEDAKALYRGGKGLDMKDEKFNDLMCKKNKAQFQATDKEYKKLSGTTIEEAIKKASSGDTEDGYVGLLGAMDDPVTFYADSLQKAFKGMGTNDDQLIRIVVSRSEVDLPAIKAKFQEKHGRSLRGAIEDETSGDYRKALLKLVDKK